MAIAENAAPDPVKKNSEPALYAETKIIQPRAVKGRFRNYKWWAMILLLGIYHLGPFLRWDRGPGAPDQAILLDMEGRRAYFFNIEIWPQEVYYLTGILALSAIMLFLISAVAGRIWCGFACWQTVYTDLFVAVEHWVVGDRNQRIALQRKPWDGDKIVKKSIIWTIWFVIAAACGIGFTLYFGDVFEMLGDIFTLNASMAVYGTIAVVGGFCFLLAGWGREQVCIYMCPYSRFQAAMFDEHSLIISYEAWRGEPRGGARKGQSFEGRGHCVDCKMCVVSCPTGIDIRNGTQLDCIGCGLCIDACDSIMDKYGLPRGLISYDSNFNLEARAKGEKPKLKLVRARTVIYTAIVLVIGAAIAFSLGTRKDIEINVLHERSPLFVQLSDGSIRNGYTYKVLNMVRKDRAFTLSVAGIEGASLQVVGDDAGEGPQVELDVTGDEVGTFRVYVSAPAASADGKATPMTFVLTEKGGDGRAIRSDTVFAGPE
ncbi:MAG: cytochrome c oxidase accessory protein CcoG [Pseudomonadota bacterium]